MATSVVRTTCPLDCPDMCGLDIEIEDGRVTGIRGEKDSPFTRGFICSKVSRFDKRVYHPTRLRQPMRRTGPKGTGAFSPISWDDAISEIVERLREVRDRFGGDAILPYHYGGSNGVLTEGFIDDLFFTKLGASRLAKTICAAPSTEAATGLYGKMPGVAYEDYPKAKCIVVWGANPKASSIHFVPFLREAKRNGAFVTVVDPRRNFSSREIDLHLPVRPGTDLPLALGLIRLWRDAGALDGPFLNEHADGVDVLLERAAGWPLDRVARVTGVEPGDIEALARVYADSEPAVIRCGWGPERNRNGGHAIAAILAMPALLGKFGLLGGGFTMSNNAAARVNVAGLLGNSVGRGRTINMTQLGEVLTGSIDPPVRALFVYNCNPAVTVPDQRRVLRGLGREEIFTVVLDQVHTDTAEFADIILPATTFLEHRDVRVLYGNYRVGGVVPVIEPEGEARSNPEVFAALGRAMGWEDEPFTWHPSEYMAKVSTAVRLNGTPADAAVWERGEMLEFDFPGRTPVQFGTVFPLTHDGKIHLAPPQLGAEPYRFQAMDEDFPLALITPASARLVSSSFGEYNEVPLEVVMHPHDANPRRIRNGDEVRVFNGLGEVPCKARVSSAVRSGVVSMPKGAWRRWSANGFTPTALCPAHVNEVGGGACFNDARVEIERA